MSDRWVTRYDRGTVLQRSPRATDEGFRLLSGRMARAGVMPYRQADGTIVWELIPPEELLDSESLGTLGLKPVTIEHPDAPVGPGNARALTDGVVSPKIRAVQTAEGGYVEVDLVVLTEDALDSVDDGKHELSPGYRCVLDPSPGADARWATDGNPEGRWDYVQRRRRYNHLAIVDTARGGPTVRLHLDAAIQIREVPRNSSDQPIADHRSDHGAAMNRAALIALLTAAGFDPAGSLRADAKPEDPVTLDEIGKVMQAATAKGDSRGMQAAFDAVVATLNATDRQMQKLQGEYDACKKELDAMKAKSAESEMGEDPDTEEEEMEDSLAARIAWAKQRADYLALAGIVGVTLDNADALDNAEIARAVAKAAHPTLRDDASDEYVAGMLDLLALQPGRQREDRRDDADVDPYADAFRAFERTDTDDAGQRADADLSPSELSLRALRGEARA